MRTIGYLAAFILFIAAVAPAFATGIMRVQENDGSVRVYKNVSIKIVHQTLRVTSADGAATFVIAHAACAYDGPLERCTPIAMRVERGGTSKSIDFTNGTIYINPTSRQQPLPRSSTQLPPHGIVLSIRTKIGTYASMTGQIDGLVR